MVQDHENRTESHVDMVVAQGAEICDEWEFENRFDQAEKKLTSEIPVRFLIAMLRSFFTCDLFLSFLTSVSLREWAQNGRKLS